LPISPSEKAAFRARLKLTASLTHAAQLALRALDLALRALRLCQGFIARRESNSRPSA
jgi:hypothetical protein